MNLLRAWATLTALSFRRLLWSTSTLMVLLPLAGCLLFVLRRHHRGEPFSVDEFRDFSEFMILVFASFVVPICALAFGTASLGGDREDRTLPDEIEPGVWEVPFALVPGSAGNVPELHGTYRLEDLGGGHTFVHYDATIDIGFWIPDVLAEWATKRVLPAILAGLEEAASLRATWLATL